MSCKFISPHTSNELGFSKYLLQYYNFDLYEELDQNMEKFFNEKVSYFFSDDFKERFGDWTAEKFNDKRVDTDGSPVIYNDNGNLFVYDKNNEKLFINNTRFEGLEAYPMFKGRITEFKNDATSMIVKHIFDRHKNNNDDLTDFSNLDFNLRDEVENFFDSQIELKPENEDFYDLLKDFTDDFVEEVKDFLSNINLSYTENDDTDESYEESLEENGSIVGKGAMERNSKDNATSNIKLMLSLLSDPESSSGYFVGNKMLSFDQVWNDVQNVLSDVPKLLDENGQVVNQLDIIKDRLDKMAYNKPYIKELLDILNSSNTNLQTQFFQAFGNLGKVAQDSLEVDLSNYTFTTYNAAESGSKKSSILTEAGNLFKNNFIKTLTITNKEGETLDKHEFNLREYNKFRQDYFKLTRGQEGKNSLITDLKVLYKKLNTTEKPSQELLNQRDNLIKESKDILSNLISKLGFELSPLAYDYLLRENGKHQEVSLKSLINVLDDFTVGFGIIDKELIKDNLASEQDQIKHATELLIDEDNNYLNIFKGEKTSRTSQKVITNIADAIAYYKLESSDNMVMSGAKRIWAYANTSHIFDSISILNKSLSEVKYRLTKPFTRRSVFLKELLNGNVIKLHRTNAMMDKARTDESVDNTTTSKNDAIVRDVVESLQGKKPIGKSLYSTAVPADKGTAYKLESNFFLNTAIRMSNDKIVVSNEALDIFKGYFNDELSTAIEAKKYINSQIDNEGNVNTANLVQYKHIDGKGNVFDVLDVTGKSIFKKGEYTEVNRNNIQDINELVENNTDKNFRMIYAGNIFKNYMTPSLSPENLLDSPQVFGLFYNSDFTPIDIDKNYKNDNSLSLTNKQQEFLNIKLTDVINDVIKSHAEKLIDTKLFNKKGGRVKFDNNLYKIYAEENKGQTSEFIMNQIVADYALNNIIAQIEFSKLYNGSINNHKNEIDYFKRVPKTYIDGKGLLLGVEENDHISNVIVLQDMETSSPYLNQMGVNEAERNFAKKYYGDGRINQADAQAYITPKRWKFLLERLGQWDKMSQEIYDKIEQINKGKNVEFTTKELKHLSTKPLKGVYFDNQNNKPLYLKYSQSVLMPSLVKGTPLEKLLKKMEENDIDEAIMESGVKVGAQFSKDNITQSLLDGENFEVKPIPIDNRFWKLQQDLPNKGFKETLLGSQIQKNIFDNLNFEGTYEFNGKEVSGKDVFNNIHSVIGELSNRGLEKIKSRFGIDENFVINNWSDFAKSIAEQLKQENIDDNIIKAVEKELTPYVIPQARPKVLSTIMSILNKSTVKLKTNGGSLIQMSNFGLDQNLAEETGIRWIKDKVQLAEPRKYLTEDGKTKVDPGQCFISGNLLSEYVPNWREYTNEQLFGENGIFPKEILQLITYRIPNQAMSSNDAMEIVGILPDTYIDTIVPYTGITTKTGSDFDIDKMFIILPSMKQQDGKVIYEQYDDSKPITEQTNGALNNRLFESYHSILTNQDNYENLITPIDYPEVKDFITKELYPNKPKSTDYQAFSPLQQIDIKYQFIAGGFGIGQVANQLVDSINNQVAQEYLDRYIGWGNYKMVDGKKYTVFDMKSDKGFYDETGTFKISSILTSLLNGFVDIAKDPYITDGNWNTQTTNTGIFLVRAGVHPYKVLSFLAQPSLVELVELTAEKEGITSNDKSSGNVLSELKDKYLQLLKESLGFTEDNWQELYNNITSKQEVSLTTELGNNKITSRSIEDLKDNIKGQKNTPKYYLEQFLALQEYDDIKPIVKEFTKSVGSSKYGETGIGKNLVSYLIQRNKTADVINNNTIQNFTNKFYNKDLVDNGYTSLGSYHKNTETFFKNLVDANPKIFVTASEFFSNIMNDIASEVHKNKKYLDDEQLGNNLESSLYSMIMSRASILRIDSSEFGYFFGKGSENDYTLSKHIMTVKSKFIENNKHNYLLENIEIKEDGNLSFIGINSLNAKSKDFNKKITDGWRELDKEDPSLSDDLVRYAYQQSGFKANANQIYQFIPHEVFVRNDINGYMNKVGDAIANGSINPDTIKDNIYRHNWDNSKIVPKISDIDEGFGEKKLSAAISIKYKDNAGFRLKYDSNRHSGKNKHMDLFTYPPFMNYNKGLFKLQGYKKVMVKGVEYYEPIYLATHKLGYKSKLGQFHEYQIFSTKSNSSYLQNNISESQKVVKDLIIKDMAANPKNIIKLEDITENESFDNNINNFEPQIQSEEVIKPSIVTESEVQPEIKSQPQPQEASEEFTSATISDNGYEVSTAGDKRFSALYAKLKDGRTIEEAYQLDIKGYRVKGNNWKLGKGKAPLNNISIEESQKQYTDLWRQYLDENPELEKDLREKAKGKVLTDKFTSSKAIVSQARSLSQLLNERKNNSKLSSEELYKQIDNENIKQQLLNLDNKFTLQTVDSYNKPDEDIVDEIITEDNIQEVLDNPNRLLQDGLETNLPETSYYIGNNNFGVEYFSIEEIVKDAKDENTPEEEKNLLIEYLKQYNIDLSEKEFVDPNQLSLFSEEDLDELDNPCKQI